MTSHTYFDLWKMAKRGELITGTAYRLSDYRTVYRDEEDNIRQGDIEPLILTAITNNHFAPIAFSEKYPDDTVYYEFENNILMTLDKNLRVNAQVGVLRIADSAGVSSQGFPNNDNSGNWTTGSGAEEQGNPTPTVPNPPIVPNPNLPITWWRHTNQNTSISSPTQNREYRLSGNLGNHLNQAFGLSWRNDDEEIHWWGTNFLGENVDLGIIHPKPDPDDPEAVANYAPFHPLTFTTEQGQTLRPGFIVRRALPKQNIDIAWDWRAITWSLNGVFVHTSVGIARGVWGGTTANPTVTGGQWTVGNHPTGIMNPMTPMTLQGGLRNPEDFRPVFPVGHPNEGQHITNFTGIPLDLPVWQIRTGANINTAGQRVTTNFKAFCFATRGGNNTMDLIDPRTGSARALTFDAHGLPKNTAFLRDINISNAFGNVLIMHGNGDTTHFHSINIDNWSAENHIINSNTVKIGPQSSRNTVRQFFDAEIAAESSDNYLSNGVRAKIDAVSSRNIIEFSANVTVGKQCCENEIIASPSATLKDDNSFNTLVNTKMITLGEENTHVSVKNANCIETGHQVTNITIEGCKYIKIGNSNKDETLIDIEEVTIGDQCECNEVGKGKYLYIGNMGYRNQIIDGENNSIGDRTHDNYIGFSSFVKMGHEVDNNYVSDSGEVTIGNQCRFNRVDRTKDLLIDCESDHNTVSDVTCSTLGNQSRHNYIIRGAGIYVDKKCKGNTIKDCVNVKMDIENHGLVITASEGLDIGSKVRLTEISQTRYAEIEGSLVRTVINAASGVEIAADSTDLIVEACENVTIGRTAMNVNVRESVNVSVSSHGQNVTVAHAGEIQVGHDNSGVSIVNAMNVRTERNLQLTTIERVNQVVVEEDSSRNLIRDASSIFLRADTNRNNIFNAANILLGRRSEDNIITRSDNIVLGNSCADNTIIDAQDVTLGAGCSNNVTPHAQFTWSGPTLGVNFNSGAQDGAIIVEAQGLKTDNVDKITLSVTGATGITFTPDISLGVVVWHARFSQAEANPETIHIGFAIQAGSGISFRPNTELEREVLPGGVVRFTRQFIDNGAAISVVGADHAGEIVPVSHANISLIDIKTGEAWGWRNYTNAEGKTAQWLPKGDFLLTITHPNYEAYMHPTLITTKEDNEGLVIPEVNLGEHFELERDAKARLLMVCVENAEDISSDIAVQLGAFEGESSADKLKKPFSEGNIWAESFYASNGVGSGEGYLTISSEEDEFDPVAIKIYDGGYDERVRLIKETVALSKPSFKICEIGTHYGVANIPISPSKIEIVNNGNTPLSLCPVVCKSKGWDVCTEEGWEDPFIPGKTKTLTVIENSSLPVGTHSLNFEIQGESLENGEVSQLSSPVTVHAVIASVPTEGVVTGNVSLSGAPLVNAEVTLFTGAEGGNNNGEFPKIIRAITNAAGNYSLSPGSGTYLMVVTHASCNAVHRVVTLPAGAEGGPAVPGITSDFTLARGNNTNILVARTEGGIVNLSFNGQLMLPTTAAPLYYGVLPVSESARLGDIEVGRGAGAPSFFDRVTSGHYTGRVGFIRVFMGTSLEKGQIVVTTNPRNNNTAAIALGAASGRVTIHRSFEMEPILEDSLRLTKNVPIGNYLVVLTSPQRNAEVRNVEIGSGGVITFFGLRNTHLGDNVSDLTFEEYQEVPLAIWENPRIRKDIVNAANGQVICRYVEDSGGGGGTVTGPVTGVGPHSRTSLATELWVLETIGRGGMVDGRESVTSIVMRDN